MPGGGGQFRCAYFARDYEAALGFYRDGLQLPIVADWDRGPDDRGTMFGAASGVVEVLALPDKQTPDPVWDYRTPQGIMLVIEADDVDAWYQRAAAAGLAFKQELTNQAWGHRSFTLTDPDGITLYIYSEAT